MTSETAHRDKKKRKAYYRKCAISNKQQCLVRSSDAETSSQRRPLKQLRPGMTGYLVTCNRQEKRALSEAYRLLNDALKRCQPMILSVGSVDALHPENNQPTEQPSVHNQTADDSDSDADVLTQLRRELAQSSTNSSENTANPYFFYSVKSGVSNCLFVVHYAECTCSAFLCHNIFEHLLSVGVSESRSLLRLLPVDATCSANPAEISKCMKQLWINFIRDDSVLSQQTAPHVGKEEVQSLEHNSTDSVVSDCIHSLCPKVPPQRATAATLHGSKTFLVLFKARNYNRLPREEAIDAVVSAVCGVDASWRVCPSSPTVIIFVNILRNVACLSLLENFGRYHKYNVAELFTQPNKDEK
ncbi:unnamed protein product [Dicrocoelium dendriticum]|nr:unnamed protein product [Dicrocoelium dendriticum]